jgi:hypothetical protein
VQRLAQVTKSGSAELARRVIRQAPGGAELIEAGGARQGPGAKVGSGVSEMWSSVGGGAGMENCANPATQTGNEISSPLCSSPVRKDRSCSSEATTICLLGAPSW